ncbi:MAG: hypothetical protein J4N84_16225, partial [Chloroflexi bacterium]|nr:hypothetical protein [Chloroflexota bacterium]
QRAKLIRRDSFYDSTFNEKKGEVYHRTPRAILAETERGLLRIKVSWAVNQFLWNNPTSAGRGSGP